MRTVKTAATIVVALLLQLLLTKYLAFFQYVDLPLVVTVYFGLHRAPLVGMGVGLVSGLCGDKITGGVLGVGGFSKTLIGYVVAAASIKFPLESMPARLAVVALASIVNSLLFAALYELLQQPLPLTESWRVMGQTIAWKTVADFSAALIVFIALDRVFPEESVSRKASITRRFQ